MHLRVSTFFGAVIDRIPDNAMRSSGETKYDDDVGMIYYCLR